MTAKDCREDNVFCFCRCGCIKINERLNVVAAKNSSFCEEFSLSLVKMLVCTGCSYTAAALYGFAEKFNTPLFALPAGGAWTLQLESKQSDFSRLVQPAFGYSDLTDFILVFMNEYDYHHIVVFRDDSYSFYGTATEPIMRFMRDRNPNLYQNTLVTAIRSLRMTSRDMYKPLLQSANERSRGIIVPRISITNSR